MAKRASEDEGPRCQVCGVEVAPEDAVRCERCDTPHHRDCWTYNEGCSTYGCHSTSPVPAAPTRAPAPPAPAVDEAVLVIDEDTVPPPRGARLRTAAALRALGAEWLDWLPGSAEDLWRAQSGDMSGLWLRIFGHRVDQSSGLRYLAEEVVSVPAFVALLVAVVVWPPAWCLLRVACLTTAGVLEAFGEEGPAEASAPAERPGDEAAAEPDWLLFLREAEGTASVDGEASDLDPERRRRGERRRGRRRGR